MNLVYILLPALWCYMLAVTILNWTATCSCLFIGMLQSIRYTSCMLHVGVWNGSLSWKTFCRCLTLLIITLVSKLVITRGLSHTCLRHILLSTCNVKVNNLWDEKMRIKVVHWRCFCNFWGAKSKCQWLLNLHLKCFKIIIIIALISPSLFQYPKKFLT